MYVFQYTQSSLQFNLPLWRGKVNSRVKARLEALDRELSQLPLHSGVPLYRGTDSRSLARMGEIREGLVIQDSGYLSTSTDEEEAQYFGDWTMKIVRSKSGRKVVLSQFPSEKEVLFGPGTKWRVLYYSEAERLLEVEEV